MSFIPPAEFGPFIKDFLEKKYLSEADAEKITYISRKTLDRWEKGDVQRIRYSTLEQFAKGFNLTGDAFLKEFEAYRESRASDSIQATDHSPDTTTTFPSMLRDTAKATMPSQIRWKLISTVGFGLVIVVLLSLFVLYNQIINPWMQSSNGKDTTLSGEVLCVNNEPVEGVWVNVMNGNNVVKDISGYANFRTTNSDGSEVKFAFVLKGDAYNLHVGCGGTKLHWKDFYYTETGSGTIHDHTYHVFTCHDAPPAVGFGSCDLKSS